MAIEVTLPLYMSVPDAAEWTGLSKRRLHEFVNSADPPPFYRDGRKVFLQTEELKAYLERKQEVRAWRNA